jgi:DNA-directed RNA polymerase sigma subunit (sigma70/sigma32)
MLTLGQYLEKTKKKLKMKTYAELARAADVSPAYLLQVRQGIHRCNDAVTIRLAKVAGDHPELVLLIADYTTAADRFKPIRELMYQQVEKYLKKHNQKNRETKISKNIANL